MARRSDATPRRSANAKIAGDFLPRDLTRHDFFDHKPNIRRPSTDVVLLLPRRWSPGRHAATKPRTPHARCCIGARDLRGLRGQRTDRLRRYREATRDGHRGLERHGHIRIRRRAPTCPASVARRRAARPPEPAVLSDRRARRDRARSTSRPGKPVTARTSSRAARAATTFPVRRAQAAATAGAPAVQGSLDAAAPPVPLDAAAPPAPRGRGGATAVPPDAAARGGTTDGRRQSDAGSKPGRRGRADVHRDLHDDPRRLLLRIELPQPRHAGGVSFASQSSAYSAVSRRVTPGNGAGSAFYNTVNSGSMPRGAAKLSATNLAKIKAWIDAGALNN